MWPENTLGHLEIAGKPSNHYDEQMIREGKRQNEKERVRDREGDGKRQRKAKSKEHRPRQNDTVNWVGSAHINTL